MEQERAVPNLVTLVVSDMESTVAFYRKLGVEIGDAMPEWEDVHRSAKTENGVGLDFDRSDFAPAWNRGWKGGPGGAGVILGFSVTSREAVDQLYAELTGAGYRSQQAPYDGFWGARYAVIEDPDGNAVGIMSAIDAAYRSEAPVPLEKSAVPAPASMPAAALTPGAEVLDNRGQKFAHVKETEGEFFKLSVPLGTDFWLPVGFVASVDGEHVHLSINRDDVDEFKLATPNRDDVINDV
ncbi:MAG TPA: VOC family protein [Tepidiformaceae bacterium]|nr:VOC family protein [Tepidiformaceae bacterium]